MRPISSFQDVEAEIKNINDTIARIVLTNENQQSGGTNLGALLPQLSSLIKEEVYRAWRSVVGMDIDPTSDSNTIIHNLTHEFRNGLSAYRYLAVHDNIASSINRIDMSFSGGEFNLSPGVVPMSMFFGSFDYIYPVSDDFTYLGKTTNRWKNIYSVDMDIEDEITADKVRAVSKLYLNAINGSGGAVSNRPMIGDVGTKEIAEGAVNLGSSYHVTGALGVPNGGTGQTSLNSGEILTGNGSGGIGSFAIPTGVLVGSGGGMSGVSGVTNGIGINLTFTIINYLDHTSTPQSLGVVTAASLDSNAFTNGIKTT